MPRENRYREVLILFWGFTMKKDVLIILKGTQEYPNIEYENSIEFLTEGKFYKKGEIYYVTYKESELTGLDGTTTTFKIQPDIITLHRFGEVSSTLYFEQGKRHISTYMTQEGILTVGVYTKKLHIDLDDHGGEVFVEYSVDLDSSMMSENDFLLKIKEAGVKN